MPAQQKPLPTPPRSPSISESISSTLSKPLPPRPLPEVPRRSNNSEFFAPDYVKTVLLVAGFAVWFLVIVVLLPIVTEKNAMPGFNKMLRRCGSMIVSSEHWEPRPPTAHCSIQLS
ncbi:hypothetical protein K491DRAFT_695231 [Lophiostoma macrostomum CBS 122681]|uniref:Uncharacterized protein n=1 Tax=Lophiostoma macrostomum CBS 122681 TaxID=1314788 RepID=A0A6A6T1R5_9PLEO|nr:hypothetical protein K491DRAFT_695231 [Lophiostoma macrostomum CBS 122681]